MFLGHLLAGERLLAAASGTLELRERFGRGEPFATVASATGRDLDAALAALAPGAPLDARLGDAAAALLERDDEATQACARAAGLEARELRAHRRELGTHCAPRPAANGVCVVAPAWWGLFRGALAALLEPLARGQAVLLLPDPRLPFPADAAARALLDAGLPPGQLAVLHGAAPELVEAALADEDVRAVVASCARGDAARLRHASTGLEARFETARCVSIEIGADEDPEQAAHELFVAALGRGRTFTGQLPGQVARAYIEPSAYAAVCDALLAVWEREDDARRPVPPVDATAEAAARAAVRRGLDDGATLVRGDPAARHGLPALFVNVGPRSALARRPGPAPLLALLRDVDGADAGLEATSIGG